MPLIVTSVFDKIKMDILLKAPFFLCSAYLIETSVLFTTEHVFCVPECGKRFMGVKIHSVTLWINTSPIILEKEYIINYTIVGS